MEGDHGTANSAISLQKERDENQRFAGGKSFQLSFMKEGEESFSCQNKPCEHGGSTAQIPDTLEPYTSFCFSCHPPFDDKMDVVPLLQYPFQFGDTIGARPFERNFVWDANDLHCLRVTGNLPVWDRDHVV